MCAGDARRFGPRAPLDMAVRLVKPSLGELEGLFGRGLPSTKLRAETAQDLIKAGNAEIVRSL